MSAIGRPPGKLTFSPTPPERGSFPLDHDGECKPVMAEYLACLKRVRGMNDPECRLLAKKYLKCRMDRNLMAVDEFKNLGFVEEAGKKLGVERSGEEKGMSKLDMLRRENEELKKKHGKA